MGGKNPFPLFLLIQIYVETRGFILRVKQRKLPGVSELDYHRNQSEVVGDEVIHDYYELEVEVDPERSSVLQHGSLEMEEKIAKRSLQSLQFPVIY